MDTIIKNAIKGVRKDLEALYSNNVKDIFYRTNLLLGSEDKTNNTLKRAFKDTLSQLNKMESEADFASAMQQKALTFAKRQVLSDSADAFTKQKSIISADDLTLSTSDIEAENIITQLPPLQRFVYVLKNICKMPEDDIASFLQVGKNVVQEVSENENDNLNCILKACGLLDKFNVKSLSEALQNNQNMSMLLSGGPDLSKIIDPLAKPFEEQQAKSRKKALKIGGTLLGIAVVASIALISAVAIKKHKAEEPSESSVFSTASDSSGEQLAALATITPSHYASIDVKDYGTITVALDASIAPKTVENFVTLANEGFYDGLTFHRIMDGFMMQGGDPEGTGGGGSDKNIVGEFEANDFVNPISHTRGVISMARAKDYNSASSQFFIVQSDSTFLDGNYAGFGCVTEGIEIVDKICADAKPTDDNGTIPASAQPVINSIKIVEAETDSAAE